jgi:hypothetical protein
MEAIKMKNTVKPAYSRIGNIMIVCRSGAAPRKPACRLPQIAAKRIGVKA